MGLKVAAEVSTFPNQNIICGVLQYFYPFISSLPWQDRGWQPDD